MSEQLKMSPPFVKLNCWCPVQRIVRMNKTEDDELEGEELSQAELKQVAG